MNIKDLNFIKIAIVEAKNGLVKNEGGPFGAVVVKNGKIVGRGNNRVTLENDPTSHAEMVAIRDACKNLGHFQLDGCTIYSTCEPCPMCLGAIYWARPDRLVYACTKKDAADFGFDDEFIYNEIVMDKVDRKIKTEQEGRKEAIELFRIWETLENKTLY
jgi:tRNA(Arg) A34 adenosine deaminase TadA